MHVLYQMFGRGNVPDPIDSWYPRWSTEEWSYRSCSNWPPGLSLETHQDLLANLEHLYFAGESLSVQYFEFFHGKMNYLPILFSSMVCRCCFMCVCVPVGG